MNPSVVEFCAESECRELDALLVERIYEFNARATGYFDGMLIGGRLRDEAGELIGAFNGHTWGGCCIIANLWVRESQRGRGFGRALLQAAEAEAVRRGCARVILSTHSFQAPGFYERLGYKQQAVIRDWPKGHADILYLKCVSSEAEVVRGNE
jgi:GNAT superfamily N-acetyltransferase